MADKMFFRQLFAALRPRLAPRWRYWLGARDSLTASPPPLAGQHGRWARRTVFHHRRRRLLVQESFLPAITAPIDAEPLVHVPDRAFGWPTVDHAFG